MTPRSIRRAAERKSAKLARKQAIQDVQEMKAELIAQRDRDISELQMLTNQRNAQRSTGPITPEGKATSSRNALKTGLTGRTVLLPSDNAERYEHHIRSFFDELQPAGDRETELVQAVADSKWRLARIPSLESGIYALGRNQFAEEFAHLPAAEAAILIDTRTFLAYQKQLNNLSIQESRLRRQCEKDTAELRRLQQLRTTAQAAHKPAAVRQAPAHPDSNGFVFSTLDDHSEEAVSGTPKQPRTRTEAA